MPLCHTWCCSKISMIFSPAFVVQFQIHAHLQILTFYLGKLCCQYLCVICFPSYFLKVLIITLKNSALLFIILLSLFSLSTFHCVSLSPTLPQRSFSKLLLLSISSSTTLIYFRISLNNTLYFYSDFAAVFVTSFLRCSSWSPSSSATLISTLCVTHSTSFFFISTTTSQQTFVRKLLVMCVCTDARTIGEEKGGGATNCFTLDKSISLPDCHLGSRESGNCCSHPFPSKALVPKLCKGNQPFSFPNSQKSFPITPISIYHYGQCPLPISPL